MYSTDQYVQVKDIEDLPEQVIKQIKMVSLPGEDDNAGSPFGSYINRVAVNFGDIDVVQIYTGCCTAEDVVKKAAGHLKKMVRLIKKTPDHWFSEFKAGIEHVYKFDIGTLVEGVYRISKELGPISEALYKVKKLDKKEIEIIRAVMKKSLNKRNGQDYDIIFNLFRDHWLLRWTEEEVLAGKKDGYLLEDALLDDTIVKIDMILINPTGKWLEVTNFMALVVKGPKGDTPINFDMSTHSPEELPIPIEELYYSDFHYKPFKIVKRAFAFLKFIYLNWDKPSFDNTKYVMRRITKSYINELLDSYTQVLKTTINILYTIVSEMDAIGLVLEMGKAPLSKVNSRFQMLKDPLSNVLELDSKSLAMFIVLIDKIISEKTQKKKADALRKTMKIFKETINFWTISYFDQLGLNPPPAAVLPDILSYNPNIFREPWDVPQNPLKMAFEHPEIAGGSFLGNVASSIFQKAANAYRRNFCDGKARPLEKGEFHLGCHNFTGPGTKIQKESVRKFKPYNSIDACSRSHDLDYMEAIEMADDERKSAIKKADKKVIECYSHHPGVSGYQAATRGINSKMTLGKVLPIVSRSIFGKISAAGRDVASVSDVKDFRLLAPGTVRTDRLRPGESPEVAKMAMKDAIKLVKAIKDANPGAIVGSIKDIAKHIVEVGNPELEPGWEWKNGRPHLIGGKGIFKEKPKTWILD